MGRNRAKYSICEMGSPFREMCLENDYRKMQIVILLSTVAKFAICNVFLSNDSYHMQD